MKSTDKPLVAIHCLVYNHEPYLRKCLDSFVMQQTNFPFVAIVHEDASRKGEHLRLVLQTTEWGGENQTVVVAFELRPIIITLWVAMLLSEALIRYQLLPIHHILGAKVTNFA